MKITSRLLAGTAVVCLGLLFFFPLWKITLEAPQYPGGISLYIWINQISGQEPSTLQNINILNHYIGMQAIVPESIPELRYFPVIVAGLMLAGAVVTALNRRGWYLGWFVLLLLLSAAGIYDFYRWEYNYGHQLSPQAPIKVPGMSYQPPLLGSKELLNFTATSLPAAGGLLLGLGLVLAFLAFLRSGAVKRGRVKRDAVKQEAVKRGIDKRGAARRSAARQALAAAGTASFLLCLQSCTVKPAPFHYGRDACSHCRMTIVDERYAAQLVTRTGKAYKFDAIECMIRFRQGRGADAEDFKLELVSGYNPPHPLLNAAGAWYVRSAELPSPMGMNLSAVGSMEEADKLRQQYGGERYDFQELQDQFGQWTK